jgi:hypothetical protein
MEAKLPICYGKSFPAVLEPDKADNWFSQLECRVILGFLYRHPISASIIFLVAFLKNWPHWLPFLHVEIPITLLALPLVISTLDPASYLRSWKVRADSQNEGPGETPRLVEAPLHEYIANSLKSTRPAYGGLDKKRIETWNLEDIRKDIKTVKEMGDPLDEILIPQDFDLDKLERTIDEFLVVGDTLVQVKHPPSIDSMNSATDNVADESAVEMQPSASGQIAMDSDNIGPDGRYCLQSVIRTENHGTVYEVADLMEPKLALEAKEYDFRGIDRKLRKYRNLNLKNRVKQATNNGFVEIFKANGKVFVVSRAEKEKRLKNTGNGDIVVGQKAEILHLEAQFKDSTSGSRGQADETRSEEQMERGRYKQYIKRKAFRAWNRFKEVCFTRCSLTDCLEV